METLFCLLSKEKEGDIIYGFLVKGRYDVEIEISHLLFANDSLHVVWGMSKGFFISVSVLE